MIGHLSHGRRGQWLALVLAAWALLLTAGAAKASFSEISAATWNMQGPFDENGESKWFSDVLRLMRGESSIPPHDVVSLQEVGGVPQGAEQTDQYAELGDALALEYLWEVGGQGSQERYYIYHLQVSNFGAPAADLQTNLAIISKRQAGEFHILRNQTGTDVWTREVIGIRLTTPNGNVMRVYSVHAGPDGHDADLIMAHIDAYDDGIADWAAMGTFNRDLLGDDAALEPPAGSYLYRPNSATHSGDDGPVAVDYAIANEEVAGWVGQRLAMPSGHGAVRFGPGQTRQANPRR